MTNVFLVEGRLNRSPRSIRAITESATTDASTVYLETVVIGRRVALAVAAILRLLKLPRSSARFNRLGRGSMVIRHAVSHPSALAFVSHFIKLFDE